MMVQRQAARSPARVFAPPVLRPPVPLQPMQVQPLPAVQRAACACGGGCPRCSAASPGASISGPVIQRAAADPSPPPDFKPEEDAAPAQAQGGEPGFDDGSAADASGGGQDRPRADEEESASAVQAAPADPRTAPGPGPLSVDRVAARLGSGSALAPQAQMAMNRFFGRDLGQVRIHTGGSASALAASLHARAFTVGEQIAFATGHYRPEHPEGQRLIAHELTHVLQQRWGLDADIQRAGIGAPGDRYEAEAERNAERFLQGAQAESPGAGTGAASGEQGALQLYAASTASAYARKWATSTNPSYPRDGNDCTNFVSQAVLAGGWAMAGGSCSDRKDDSAWWYGDSQCWYPGVHRSYTWGGAQNFYNFISSSGRGTAAAHIYDLDVGDVLQVAHDGHVGHTTMVTGKPSGNLLLSYHTNDTLDLPVWGPGGFLSKYAGSFSTTTYYAWKL